jgi:eukaryotic-like serine/threonine-protein kinase
MHGRLHDATKLLGEWERIDSLRGLPHDPLTSQLTAAALETRLLERPAAALRRLDSLAALPSLRGRESLAMAASYAEAGVPGKARQFLSQYDADTRDTAVLRVASNIRRAVVGQIAVAEKKYDEAIAALWASDTLYDGAPVSCESCAIPPLARAYDRAGKTDQAIAMLERYVHDTYAFRFANTDPYYLTPSYERLAQLYEQRGDRANAITDYGKFIELWKNADPELQPRVADAKKRMVALTAGEKR